MKPGELLRVVTGQGRTLRCEACGAEFTCGGGFGCWCTQVPLDEATRTAIREKYKDCLCRACLERLARP